MRECLRPATYAEIAAAIGVSETTAHRWAVAPVTPSTRQPRRVLMCARCAGPGSRVYVRCRLCRSVLRHAASARRITALIADGTEPRAAALRRADRGLGEIKVELLLRQMRATGVLPAGRTGPRDLAHPTIVRALVEGRRPNTDGTTAAQREAATMAAGCILAARD
ncbi:hypothetical protein SK069_18805 [Patulibacter brassicae]|jgi:hypothetical protein|uniref:Helix-turn-helix domain-containing protein n=1 Tax=Patulibacter brassicae TaxID=1705717 RepID=A0ABU4VP62_9ACTN|nr:hypothetical protein [Patulibacter brassicae]MDX8153654.1 hypothetical protein [Patulibacter brassicae]